MDDGFQNPALAKDLSLLVFDAATGAGNGRVVPAGQLREPLKAGLARADAVIVMHNGKGDEDDAQSLHEALAAFRGVVLSARLEPADAAPQGRLVAFAGIGRPDKFFDTLRMLGADVADFVSFPDHHPYAEADLERLRAHAQTHQARLVTTEKDHVRLPPHLRDTALTLPVTAVFDDAAALDALLDGALAKRKD